MILDLLCILVIIVIITDLSGWADTMNRILGNALLGVPIGKFKIVSCSLCQMHWVGLLYIIVTSNFSFPSYALVLFLAYMTTVVKDILLLIKDIFIKINDIIYEKIINK